MGLMREMRLRARNIAFPVLWLVVAGYFSYHFFHGERGLYALIQLKQQIAEAEVTAKEVAGQRLVLESRVALLKPEHLDPDMLEERSRIVLGVGRDDEVVILTP